MSQPRGSWTALFHHLIPQPDYLVELHGGSAMSSLGDYTDGMSIELELQPDNDGKGDAKTDESIQVHQHEATGFRVSVRRIHQIHGFLKGDDTSPASLLVLKFVIPD